MFRRDPAAYRLSKPTTRTSVGLGAMGVCLFLLSPAVANTRITAGAAGTERVAVISWAEIPFRTVIRQQFDFSCGSAAVATMLSYNYGYRTAEQPVFAEMWRVGDQPIIRKQGFSMLDIKRYLDRIGYKAEGFRLTIAKLKAVDQPGIIILNLNGYKHFVVIKGVTGDKVVVGDPMLGLMKYTFADLAARWNGIFLTIVAKPDHRPVLFNTAGDITPWAGTALSAGVARSSLAQTTNYLPPFYQITPTVLTAANGAVGP